MDAGGLPVFQSANQAAHQQLTNHLQLQHQQHQQQHQQQQHHQQQQQLQQQLQQQQNLVQQGLHLQQQQQQLQTQQQQQQHQQLQQQQQQNYSSTGEILPPKRQAVVDRLRRRIENYRRRQSDCVPRFEQTFSSVCEQQNHETSVLQKRYLESKAKRAAKKTEKKQPEMLSSNLQSSVHVTVTGSNPKAPTDVAYENEIDKLKTQVRSLQNKVAELTDKKKISAKERKNNALSTIRQYLPKEFIEILSNALSNSGRINGSRYSDEVKEIALKIYYASPSCYSYLKNILSLPTRRTLERFTENWPSTPGFHDIYFQALQCKTRNMNNNSKMCVVLADEMSIKSNLYYDKSSGRIIGLQDDGRTRQNVTAKYALVLMARGINENWKQPLAYFLISKSFSAGKTRNLVFEATRKLRAHGLDPKAFICDQGTNFQSFQRLLGIDANNCTFAVDNKEIAFMYDPPHLLKSVRNNLMDHNILVCGKKVDFEDIVKFYNWDSTNSLNLAPKLNASNMRPNTFQRMRVCFAAHILSNTVASGIKTQVVAKSASESAETTADFIQRFDQLFDLFNATKRKHYKPMKRCFNGSMKQISFLNDMKKYIQTIQVQNRDGKDITKTVKCFRGWLLSIESLKWIWTDCHKDGLESLITRNISQDSLEHLFGTLRSYNGNCLRPTPRAFMFAFKKACGLKFLEEMRNRNCSIRGELPFETGNSNIFRTLATPISPRNSGSILVIDPEFKAKDFAENNALHYVSGYLLKKSRDHHHCLHPDNGTGSESSTFIAFKEYENCNLVVPTRDFVTEIEQIDKKFREVFNELIPSENIESKIFEKVQENYSYRCCDNYDAAYIIRLFIRVRIYFLLKKYNKILQEPNSRHKILSVTNR